MAIVEPVPNAPAATVSTGDGRALLIADYHAGIEAGLRYERGVELESAADERRARLLDVLSRTEVDRLVVLGDLGHRIGATVDAEREELAALLDAVTVPVTLVQGNHDAGVLERFGDRIDAAPADGLRTGRVGLVHGHTWPAASVISADVLCLGHEHPTVRLEDRIGGSRTERAWLRGGLDRSAFAEQVDGFDPSAPGLSDEATLVVLPAFNERSGGTWINVPGEGFLAPFLPDAVRDGEAYLLDGTRLGDYRAI